MNFVRIYLSLLTEEFIVSESIYDLLSGEFNPEFGILFDEICTLEKGAKQNGDSNVLSNLENSLKIDLDKGENSLSRVDFLDHFSYIAMKVNNLFHEAVIKNIDNPEKLVGYNLNFQLKNLLTLEKIIPGCTHNVLKATAAENTVQNIQKLEFVRETGERYYPTYRELLEKNSSEILECFNKNIKNQGKEIAKGVAESALRMNDSLTKFLDFIERFDLYLNKKLPPKKCYIKASEPRLKLYGQDVFIDSDFEPPPPVIRSWNTCFCRVAEPFTED